jgi:hypothetical protein
MPRIYIDTDSGNWGIDDGNLVIVEAEDEEINELLEATSDSTITEMGKRLDREQNQVTLCPKCRTAFTGPITDHPCV